MDKGFKEAELNTALRMSLNINTEAEPCNVLYIKALADLRYDSTFSSCHEKDGHSDPANNHGWLPWLMGVDDDEFNNETRYFR